LNFIIEEQKLLFWTSSVSALWDYADGIDTMEFLIKSGNKFHILISLPFLFSLSFFLSSQSNLAGFLCFYRRVLQVI